MELKIKPWAIKSFELIFHAEVHFRGATDYDRRLALISYDNSIEVSIATYLSLHPIQRGNRQYTNIEIESWTKNFHTKIGFFIEEIGKRKLPVYKGKDEIVWYHDQRNELYHGKSSGIPSLDVLNEIRQIAIWVYSVLFDDSDIETKLKEAILKSEVVIPTIPDSYVIPTPLKKYQNIFSKEQITSIIIGVLLGSWDENNLNDQEIIRKFVSDYESWIIDIREVLQVENSPFNLKNGKWEVNNRRNLIEETGSRIFDKHLDIIEVISKTILSELDPKFEMPAEERYMANLHGKNLKYSIEIRKGIAETLAILGCNGSKLTNCTQRKPEATANRVIYELFKNADWILWGSLENLLPILAEASPEQFLSAVETALRKTPVPFLELFAQEGSGISGNNYISGLLWALEDLAWSDVYLARVILILGELAAIDPGGQWSNRPEKSITTILLPWFPQTIAPIETRINCLKSIQKEYPEIARKVLLKLLPNQHQISMGSHKPVWRNFIPEDWEVKVSNEEYWNQINAYAGLAIKMAMENQEYIMELVNNLDNLPTHSFDSLLGFLSTKEIIELPEDTRMPIWVALTSFIRKHRRFSTAKWALNPEKVNRIEDVATKLQPKQPQNIHYLLFNKNGYDLYESNENFEKQEKELEEKRKIALQEILEFADIQAVIEFAKKIDIPSNVGQSLGQISNKKIDDYLLPKFLDDQDSKIAQFISSFISSHYFKDGLEWVKNLDIIDWSEVQKIQFLTCLPFESDIWSLAQNWLGNSELKYWQKINANPFPTRCSLFPAVDKLLLVNRPYFALNCLYANYFRRKEFDQKRTINALLKGITSTEPAELFSVYHIVELIKMLQKEPTVDPEDLYKIEWAYLQILDRHNGAEPLALEKRLSTQPEFFCEIIQLLYKSKKDGIRKSDFDVNRKSFASNAWRLLHEWRRPPGILDDGIFSTYEFLKWINQVKEICVESGHLDIALSHVGNILFYSPADNEGLWIHKSVAEILNEKDSNEIRQGFSTEAFNSRGAYMVDPTGKPERELAEEWRRKANQLESEGFVRFATTLKGIAQNYDRDAERIIADKDDSL